MWKNFVIILCFIIKICNCSWEDIESICPSQCYCQYAHMNDLSISRWISNFHNLLKDDDIIETDTKDFTDTINGNQAYYENDESYMNNPMTKLVTCMLHKESNVKVLISSIPQDTNALVLLYTGIKANYSIQTSDITLPELEILEIRGNDNERNLHLVIDVPMKEIKHANFESIHISSSEALQRRLNSIDPSEHFDYVPLSEKVEYNVTIEKDETEIKILPYEVYISELKKSRTMSFYGWNNLEILRIHYCKLDELHWEIFDGLNKLKHLSLEHNGIKIIPPFAFFGVPHVQTLSLARNNILDLNYRALAGLLDLISLDLRYNDLNKLSEITFPPFPKLKTIDLRYNPIKYIFTHVFNVMNNTRNILIGDENTPLAIEGRATFRSLEKLEYLSISNINITTFQQSILQYLKNIEILKFNGFIKYIEFDAFAETPNVKELILSKCQIEELSMDAFYGITEIEIIDLSFNKLKFLPPGIFDEKIKLKEIYLNNNQLRKLSNKFFDNLIDVKLIRLIENPWICSCDMINWKQEITNKIRKSKIKPSCLYDQLKSYKQCKIATIYKRQYNYAYDNKMAPRCNGGPENVMGRSVYYALRRNLKCRIKENSKKIKLNLPENRQKIRIANKLIIEEQTKHNKEKLQREQITRSHKILNTPYHNENTNVDKYKNQKIKPHIPNKFNKIYYNNLEDEDENNFNNNIF